MVRLISGVLLAASFLVLVWFGNAVVLLMVALAVGVLALHEFAELMRQLGAAIPRLAAVVATMAVITVVPFPYAAPVGVIGVGLVVIAIGSMVGAARLKPGFGQPFAQAANPVSTSFSRAVSGAAAGGFGMLYIGVPIGALVSIHIFGGRGAVVLLVATIVISDTAQYYSGRAFGRHPLAPHLSPKKTIEGAVGGFVVAPIFLYLAGPYLIPVVTPLMIAPLGVALVACGIAGDLFESMIKRAADLKDSSALIPGHGGILDRIDALLFATPPFYLFVRWAYAA